MVSNIRLFVNYASRTVEKKTEYFINDFMTLAISLGGTIGLLLGYSLQSFLVSMINSLEGFILSCVPTRDDGELDRTIETIESAATSPTPEQRSSGATPLTPGQINDATRPEPRPEPCPEWPPMVDF